MIRSIFYVLGDLHFSESENGNGREGSRNGWVGVHGRCPLGQDLGFEFGTCDLGTAEMI
jgi:hypothetical protein